MALRAKIRGKWRTVSPAMARVFRKRGVRVEDTAVMPAGETAIAPPVAEGPAADDHHTARRCRLCGEPGHTKRTCPLAELDALTAPDGDANGE